MLHKRIGENTSAGYQPLLFPLFPFRIINADNADC
jgi:hypothetical protein